MVNSSRKKVGSKFSVNNIGTHQDNISSSIKSGSEDLDALNQRLKKFYSKCNNEQQAQRNKEWIRQFNTYNEEILFVSKSIKNFLSSTQSIKALGLDVMEDNDDDNTVIKEKTKRLVYTLTTLRSKDNIFDILQSLRNEYNQEIEYDNNKSAIYEKDISSCEEKMSWFSKESHSSLLYQVFLALQKFQILYQCAIDVDLIDGNESHDKIETIYKIFKDTKTINICVKDNTFESESEKNGEERNISTLSHATLTIDSLRHTVIASKERRNNQLDINAEVDVTIRKLNDVTMQLIEETWMSSASLAMKAMEEERKHRLTFLRRIHTLTDEIQQDHIMLSSSLKAERAKVDEDREQKQRLITKIRVDEYHNMKQALEQEQMKEREILLRREEEQKKERLLKNIKRVHFRQEEYTQKEKTRNLAKERKAENEAAKLKKLESLKSTVPYHSSIISMKSDLTKSTVARMNDIFEPACDTDLLDFQQGMKKLTGFTDKRLFSDPKFRLAHALHESGTASNRYSIAVVKQLIPREPDRVLGDPSHHN